MSTAYYLRKLGEDFGIAKPLEQIEVVADKLSDFIDDFSDWGIFPELKESLEQHLSRVMVSQPTVKGFRHYKRRKYT
jgi:serine/threonine-protein kinase HipA